jgi:hypothetical protein
MLTQVLSHHFGKAKSFLGNGYQRLSKFAGEVDRLAGVGRRAFGFLAPILEDFGASSALTHGMKAIKNYDQIRQGVMEADQYARGHAARLEAL